MKTVFSKVAVLTSAVAILATTAPQAYAAPSQGDQCAIWICLPAAFAFSECDDAFDAMIWRVTQFKPPVPSFAGCVAGRDGEPANQTRATSSYEKRDFPACAAGYSSSEISRRGPDLQLCTSTSRGDTYVQIDEGDDYYHVTLEIDGQSYEYSFNADNPGYETPRRSLTPGDFR